MATIEEGKFTKAQFETKAKARFEATGSYACEHGYDLRNVACIACRADFPTFRAAKPVPKLTKKPDPVAGAAKRSRAKSKRKARSS